MTTHVGTVVLPNPVMTASGTAGHGVELERYFDLSLLGAFVVKSLSAEPWEGNPAPRLLPVTGGMLNSVGLQNPGVDAWVSDDLPALERAGARVVVSVWGRSAAEYAEVGRRLAAALSQSHGPHGPGPSAGAVVAVEANISCPNLEDRQRMFSHSCEGATAAVSSVIEALAGTQLSVWAKLSPNVTDLVPIAGAALGGRGRRLDPRKYVDGAGHRPGRRVPSTWGGGGGLSGPALHPVAVRAVYECRQAFPQAAIVGVGGVSTGFDAAELLGAGADAVQVGTASFVDPRAPLRVLNELRDWCASHGLSRLSQLAGGAQRNAAGSGSDEGPRARPVSQKEMSQKEMSQKEMAKRR